MRWWPVTVDVLLLGWKQCEQPLKGAGLSVVSCSDFESGAAMIRSAEKVKVLLFDGALAGGSGFDLVQFLRATQGTCLVGQVMPTPALKYYVDPARPLPGKMDFWLGDPFSADDVVELVARYDNGEARPPPGWNGLFIDPEDLDYSGIDPKQLAWTDNAMIEDMRSRLTPENFNKWLEMIQPGLHERLKRAEDWHNTVR